MKVKCYEKNTLIYFIIIMTIIIEIVGIIFLSILKTYSYKKLSGIVVKDNVLVLMIDSNDKKILYKNQTAYVDNYCKKYTIVEDRGEIFKRGKTTYYELIVSIEFQSKYKPNDLIELSLKDNKYQLIKMFKIIWEGD